MPRSNSQLCMDRNISRFKFAGHIPAVEKTRASWQTKSQFLVSFSLLFFFFFFIFPGGSKCERQALFTGWSELPPGDIAGALCSWGEAGGAEEVLQARLWLSKAHTHKGRNILCLCSNLTMFSGGKLRIYKWGPNHSDFQSCIFPELHLFVSLPGERVLRAPVPESLLHSRCCRKETLPEVSP